jgi:hypothetical protein
MLLEGKVPAFQRSSIFPRQFLGVGHIEGAEGLIHEQLIAFLSRGIVAEGNSRETTGLTSGGWKDTIASDPPRPTKANRLSTARLQQIRPAACRLTQSFRLGQQLHSAQQQTLLTSNLEVV